jgi:hypothetical protein
MSDDSHRNKNDFYESIKHDRNEYHLLIKELAILKDLGEREAIDKKRIEIYTIMVSILEKKRELFQSKVQDLKLKYDDLKTRSDELSVLDNMNVCHEQMNTYQNVIDTITQRIRTFQKYVLSIEAAIKKAHDISVLTPYSIEDKKNIIHALEPLYARVSNLEASGASPTEIASINAQVQALESKFKDVLLFLGHTEDDVADELTALRNNVRSDLDLESLRRKNLTDKYKYRFDKRETTNSIEVNRINKKGSTIKRVSVSSENKVDHRLSAPRSDHDKPSKIIEKE